MSTRTKKRKTKDQRDVKTRILDTATKLFAERGLLGVSLREIMSTADVNVASAHYYFGSKEKLYEACVLRFFVQVDTGRRNGLKRIMTTGDLSTEECLRQILLAYIEPHYKLLTDKNGANYVRMLARFLAEPPEMTRALLQKPFGDTRKMFLEALIGIFPDVEKDDLRRVFSFFVEFMLNAPSDLGYEALSGKPAYTSDPAQLTNLVVTFAMGGFIRLSE